MTKKQAEELVYTPTKEKNSAILGTLEGPCADFINPTRNGRKYSQELWEKVFNSDIAKEYFKNGGYPGECGHPADRLETDMEKIAIMMPEPPKKDSSGRLVAKFHILDTPCGRIAKTLADYGYKLGISSRGNGDVVTDMDGSESVDPDTYDFQGFDLVLLPAVESARLSLVKESLDKNNKTFKQALTEALNSAKVEEKPVMLETLKTLNIDYSPEKADNKSVAVEAAGNARVPALKQLQEALKDNRNLEKRIKELQEELSVCYAKEAKQEEDLKRYKESIVTLSNNVRGVKALNEQLSHLKEEVNKKNQSISSAEEDMKDQQSKMEALKAKNLTLRESLRDKSSTIEMLSEQVQTLKAQLNESRADSDRYQEELKENLREVKNNSAIRVEEYKKRLAQANALVEKYKTLSTTSVDRYITAKAKALGIKPEEIKTRLSEKYSFDDIDSICEDLQSYKLNLNSLPFNFEPKQKVSMRVTESKEPILSGYKEFDDEVDDQLLNLINR